MTRLIAVLICSLSVLSCRKHPHPPQMDGDLPIATTTGQIMFACHVNGKPFISSTSHLQIGGAILGDTLGVFGTPKSSGNFFESISLLLRGHFQQGQTYVLDNNLYSATYLTDSTCLGFTGSQLTSVQSISGAVELTRLDTAAKIFSGLFHCVIPVPGCDTLKVTDGRFDIHY
jgi:hypothetical protein